MFTVLKNNQGPFKLKCKYFKDKCDVFFFRKQSYLLTLAHHEITIMGEAQFVSNFGQNTCFVTQATC